MNKHFAVSESPTVQDFGYSYFNTGGLDFGNDNHDYSEWKYPRWKPYLLACILVWKTISSHEWSKIWDVILICWWDWHACFVKKPAGGWNVNGEYTKTN